MNAKVSKTNQKQQPQNNLGTYSYIWRNLTASLLPKPNWGVGGRVLFFSGLPAGAALIVNNSPEIAVII
jgi:hypothetical protein